MSIISGITCKNGTSLVLTAPTTVDLSVVNIYNTGGSNVTIDGHLTVPGTTTIGTLALTNLTANTLSATTIFLNTVQIPYIQSGLYNTTGSFFNGTTITRTISFPIAFNSPPVVTFTLVCNSAPGSNQGGPTYWIQSITSTNFIIAYVFSSNNTWPGSAIGNWTWIAVGQPN